MDQFFREGASATSSSSITQKPQQHLQPDGGLSKVQRILDREKSVKQIEAEIKAVNKMECSHVDFKPCVDGSAFDCAQKQS